MTPRNCHLCCLGILLWCEKYHSLGFLKHMRENGLRGSININYPLHFCILIEVGFVQYPGKWIWAVRGRNKTSCEHEPSQKVWTWKFYSMLGSQALRSWGIIHSSLNLTQQEGSGERWMLWTGGLSKAPPDHALGISQIFQAAICSLDPTQKLCVLLEKHDKFP